MVFLNEDVVPRLIIEAGWRPSRGFDKALNLILFNRLFLKN
jgi:hypothetical protein